ncbi:Target SNARE coiled-coil homology domain [Arabidopsis suecica]|uniref:Target SNARE coiled-coil homology domain n=1 Tax=Arabidopsis suecica TaxID=45249 RepID=A0A8T1Z618_ARASU|nr:Target SNARE coiled-coil homology domain [Arabidopsis suecica]
MAAKNFSLNPFDDTDDEEEAAKSFSLNPFDDDDDENKEVEKTFTSSLKLSGGKENQTVQQLESYAVYESEETTKTVKGCLKVAEEIRCDATKTLVMLNEQRDQITRTHHKAVDIDHHLSRGEKILGRLGGIFSRTWKPKKTRSITGPVITKGDSPKRRVINLKTQENLGLNHSLKPKSRTLAESVDAYQKTQMEIAKQDEVLSNLSNLLGELKNMAVDMGTAIESENHGLDHLQDDVDELNYRVKQSNQRAGRLLRK